MNEWEFVAKVASWIDGILRDYPRLPFSEARCEQRGRGSRKRRDLTLLADDGSVVLTGEVRLPYRHDGGSPYNEKLVQNARRKARRAGCDYFFTWNVNECVLWETFPPRTAHNERKYKSWDVTNVTRESHLEQPMTFHAIMGWLPDFLHHFANIWRGKIELGLQSPDEKFIEALESSLKMPINLTLEELAVRYHGRKFKADLDRWMRVEQGWLISDEPEDIRENLERASKFACYALVNKLVFYEALIKRYVRQLDKIVVQDHITTGEQLRLHLWEYFADGIRQTRDYETVFGGDFTEIGNCIPFYSDLAVWHWRTLLDQIHLFDFSKLDYDVIGNIFERLIAPEERHKY